MTQETPLHVFGDLRPLPWPKGAPCLWTVETDRGHYVATYRTQTGAQKHADRLRGYRDAKVSPVFLTR